MCSQFSTFVINMTGIGKPRPAPGSRSVRIVDYTPSYGDHVVALFVSGMEGNISASSDPDVRKRLSAFILREMPKLRDVPAFINEAGGGRFFLALSPTDNDLAGILAMARSDEDAEQQTVELARISVAKEWRRKGVCRALVAHAIREAVEKLAVRTVYLYTLSTLKGALTAYERMSFVVQGPRGWTEPTRLNS